MVLPPLRSSVAIPDHRIARPLPALLLIAGVAQAQTPVGGLGFETASDGRPVGWMTMGAQYDIRVDSATPFAGRYSLRSAWTGTAPFPTTGGTFGAASQVIPPAALAGRRVRLSGYVRTQGIDAGYAGLWMR